MGTTEPERQFVTTGSPMEETPCDGSYSEPLPPEQAQLVDSIQTASAAAPVTWLCAPYEVTMQVLPALRARLEASQGRCLVAGLPSAERSAFAPLRPLLHQLVSLAQEEAPETLISCAPEFKALLPDAAIPLFTQAPSLQSLVQVALSSYRTLPLDSEYALRIAMRIGWLMSKISAQANSAAGRRPLLVFPVVDHLDRPTLMTVYHLCCRLAPEGFRLLLTSSSSPESLSNHEQKHLFDTSDERHAFIKKIYERTNPLMLHFPTPASHAQMPQFKHGDDLEAQRHRAALTALHTSSLAESRTALLEAAEVSIQHLNAEPVLRLVEFALSRATEDTPFAVQLWQTAGIAHATIGNYSQAVDCFQHGFQLADEPVLVARLAMYLALVFAKRLGLCGG